MPKLVFFPGCDEVEATIVGGKGASLIRLVAAGLPVPPGAVLTTAFFEPWFATLKASEGWRELVAAPREQWPGLCDALKKEPLPLSREQAHVLEEAAQRLPPGLVAVRSSSPEEDLASASFAGGYETRLGVNRDGLEAAVRVCFASSLDARVMVYKAEHGFDPYAPRIAVVIQQQIASDVAGVGLSINPLTNDYDEAVFDAAWGLGESVVSGAVSPDHLVVNKVSGAVVERRLGAKEAELALKEGGGIAHLDAPRSDQFSLTDDQVGQLLEIIQKVEGLYGDPVDIEWAISGGEVFLLQARPVTAWVPLPKSMQTDPGARRRLYQDLALSGGLTMNAPMTPIGQSWFDRFAGLLINDFLGRIPVTVGPSDRLWFLDGGRMYQDLSNVLWMSTPGLLAMGLKSTDALVGRILGTVDAKIYRAERIPSWLSFRMLGWWLRAQWRLRTLVGNVLRALFKPAAAQARYVERREAYHARLGAVGEDDSIDAIIAAHSQAVLQHTLVETMPPLLAALAAQAVLQAVIPKAHAELGAQLELGYEGNVVVEMGTALQHLAHLLSDEERADAERLAQRLEAGDLPDAFMLAWAEFLARFGWRGPGEVDLGTPRYADDPRLALGQICTMGGTDFDPAAAQRRLAAQRQEATQALMGKVGPVRRRLIRWALRVVEPFLGTRDNPKHDYLRFFAVLRRRALTLGEGFMADGRLDHAEDIMGLTLEDILAAQGDAGLDLRARVTENTAFTDRLRRLVKAFPPVIDSRGRILRPPALPEAPGQVAGTAVSRGVALGPVKILHHPDEKPVEPGDILVAHTTDPGWTPLFVNAAAVVLEVGGVLQHGALVAREYGKPCVVGIDNLLGRFVDGEIVEVDGAEGVVRRVSPPASPPASVEA